MKAEMEDLQRALEDRNLAVSTVPEKGRSLFATRDFYPGLSLSLSLTSLNRVVLIERISSAGE